MLHIYMTVCLSYSFSVANTCVYEVQALKKNEKYIISVKSIHWKYSNPGTIPKFVFLNSASRITIILFLSGGGLRIEISLTLACS